MALWLVTAGYLSEPSAQRIDDRPCPCIQAAGINGVRDGQSWIEESDSNPIRGMSARDVREAAKTVARAGAARRAASRR
jgi:hypothetical protein